MGAIYKLDFANGKSYIGITSKDAKHRFRAHKTMSSLGEDVCFMLRGENMVSQNSQFLQF